MFDNDWLRRTCLAFPGVTEEVQWQNALLFKVGGKMFAVGQLEPGATCLSFKCSDEAFAEWIERPGVIPAPYLARAKWVALEREDAIPRQELAELLRSAYDLVRARLPRRLREGPAANRKSKTRKARPRRRPRH
ncbi:MAG TPA: MmcQ/YjbR family DNA-binding protein [Dongiaceae bacterium]|nr:MmcQ/YjbR family DNA-binding protein [Dongiaceae bacterium]